eukprot:m.363875 g.363875  ORF g.363875 m.363875 type:complete len:894 (-) comp24547_c0_seq1:101-2782(-)
MEGGKDWVQKLKADAQARKTSRTNQGASAKRPHACSDSSDRVVWGKPKAAHYFGGSWQGKSTGSGSSSSTKGHGRAAGGVATSAGALSIKVSISLSADAKNIIVASQRYSHDVNTLCRELKGTYSKTCLGGKGGWELPVAKYRLVLQALERHFGSQVLIEPLPSWITTLCTTPLWKTQPVLEQKITAQEMFVKLNNKLPQPLLDKLLPHQRSGIACAVARQGRVLWCDEMGLGKTLQALVTAFYYREEWPLLIVCPSSLKLTWAAELSKWLQLGDDSVNVVHTSRGSLSGAVVIMSYSLVSKFGKQLSKFKVVIADEAHYLKNGKAQRARALVPIIQSAPRALLLSGTPALSKPIELFQQLKALYPKLFKVEVKFGVRYCNSQLTHFGWTHDGSTNEDELYAVLSRAIMIRRTKAQVLTELPPKTRQTVLVECPSKFRAEIRKLSTRKASVAGQSGAGPALTSLMQGGGGSELNSITMQLFKLTGEAKLKASISYIELLLETVDKLIIFAHHQHVLDAIMDRLCKWKVRHIRIDGATPTQHRQQLADRFQTDPACRVALLSITAAGTGLTLHAASTVLFAELYWNPGQLLQAEDRAHRVGQTCSVNIKYILCRGTLDDTMWEKLQAKATVVGKTVEGEANACIATHADPALHSTSSQAGSQAPLNVVSAIDGKGADGGSDDPAARPASFHDAHDDTAGGATTVVQSKVMIAQPLASDVQQVAEPHKVINDWAPMQVGAEHTVSLTDSSEWTTRAVSHVEHGASGIDIHTIESDEDDDDNEEEEENGQDAMQAEGSDSDVELMCQVLAVEEGKGTRQNGISVATNTGACLGNPCCDHAVEVGQDCASVENTKTAPVTAPADEACPICGSVFDVHLLMSHMQACTDVDEDIFIDL